MRFSLFRFRSPLLTESRLFSLPVGTEMFHFPTFPPHALCVQARVTPHDWCGVPPFGHPRINARLAAPRGLSQPPTSFIGSWCQGIHRMPLLTWPQRCSRPLCSSQGTGGTVTVTIACRQAPVVRCGDGPRGKRPDDARSLRTQQRAYGVPVQPKRSTPDLEGRQYWLGSSTCSRTSQRSTHELPRQVIRLTSGPGRPPRAARCSLERR